MSKKYKYYSPIFENEARESQDTEAISRDSASKCVGIVKDCARLNVRREPSMESEVLVTVASGDEIEVFKDKFDAEWYAVCTAAGVEGFCMRNYVNVSE